MNNYRIDNLQYCNWSKEIFQINNEAKLDAVHVTIAYHEDFNEVQKNVEAWNKHFQDYKNLIFHLKLRAIDRVVCGRVDPLVNLVTMSNYLRL